MRPLLPILLPLAALGGCAGYAIDYTKPKPALIAPQLPRYGLDEDQARCFAASLSGSLTVWQMRQLQQMSAALADATPVHVPLTAADLLRAASFVQDREVAPHVARAVESCDLIPPPAMAASQAPDDAMEKTAPDQSLAGNEAKAAPSKIPNGPADYQPSDALLAALEAFGKDDHATAARLSKAAAEAGDSGAQQFLGGLYAFGKGVREDPAEAARWFGAAAEQGWSEAMNNLGRAYAEGKGVARDSVQALKWYMLASNRATEDQDLVAANIRELVATMTVEDIQKGAALASEWERSRR